MIRLEMLLSLLISVMIGNAQENKIKVNAISTELGSNRFTTGDVVDFLSLEVESSAKLNPKIRFANSESENDFGAGLSYIYKPTEKTVLVSYGYIGDGIILPRYELNQSIETRLKDSLTLLGSANTLKIENGNQLYNTSFGISKLLKKHTLIGRLFNSSESGNLINPNYSVALLNGNEKRLLQFHIQAGQQNFIVLDQSGANYQKQFGGGIWYKRNLSRKFQLSVTTGLTNNYPKNQESFIAFNFQSSLKYQFNHGK